MHVKTLNVLFLRQTTIVEIIHNNSQVLLAMDEKEIRLDFRYICHHLFVLKDEHLKSSVPSRQSLIKSRILANRWMFLLGSGASNQD